MAERSVGRLTSEGRDATVEELRERVSYRFRSVGAAAGALRAQVRRATDVRRVARRHPAWVLATAAGAGLFATALVRRARRRGAELGAQAALDWLPRVPGGPGRSRGLAAVGAPVVRGAFSILVGVLVRRFGRRLKEELTRSELRSRPRLVSGRAGLE